MRYLLQGEDEDSYGPDGDCLCLCGPEGIYTANRVGDPDDLDPLVIQVSEIDINMELGIGWSMISLPVSPDNMVLSHLFPGAVVVYGYEKGVGYGLIPDSTSINENNFDYREITNHPEDFKTS